MIKILPTDAQERKAIPVYTGFIKYFPRAIAAVAKISLIGGIQHEQTPETLHWDRSKSGDELDALSRHILDGEWDQVAWRAMANLEKQEEAKALYDSDHLMETLQLAKTETFRAHGKIPAPGEVILTNPPTERK